MSVRRQPVGFFGISGFAFWQRSSAMWYWWSVIENSLKYKIENFMKTSLESVKPSWKSPSYLWGNEMILHVYKIRKAIFMMTSSNGNIFRVTGPLCGEFTGPGEFPTQRPVTRSFDVFFDLRLNKRLSKQPWGWWFETRSWSLWRQCNVYFMSVTSTNNISFQKSYCPTETKTIWDTKGEGNKTYKTNLVIKK